MCVFLYLQSQMVVSMLSRTTQSTAVMGRAIHTEWWESRRQPKINLKIEVPVLFYFFEGVEYNIRQTL